MRLSLSRSCLILLEATTPKNMVEKMRLLAASGRGGVHFGKIIKLGVRPVASYSTTPYGIYFYPFKEETIKCFLGGATSASECGVADYATKSPYIHLVEFKPAAWQRMLTLSSEDGILSDQEFQELLSEMTSKKMLTPSMIVSASSVKGSHSWNKDAKFYYLLKTSFEYSGKDQKKMTFFLLKHGFAGVHDKGFGLIHHNEPEQIVMFKTSSFNHVYTGDNRLGKNPEGTVVQKPEGRDAVKLYQETFRKLVVKTMRPFLDNLREYGKKSIVSVPGDHGDSFSVDAQGFSATADQRAEASMSLFSLPYEDRVQGEHFSLYTAVAVVVSLGDAGFLTIVAKGDGELKIDVSKDNGRLAHATASRDFFIREKATVTKHIENDSILNRNLISTQDGSRVDAVFAPSKSKFIAKTLAKYLEDSAKNSFRVLIDEAKRLAGPYGEKVVHDVEWKARMAITEAGVFL